MSAEAIHACRWRVMLVALFGAAFGATSALGYVSFSSTGVLWCVMGVSIGVLLAVDLQTAGDFFAARVGATHGAAG